MLRLGRINLSALRLMKRQTASDATGVKHCVDHQSDSHKPPLTLGVHLMPCEYSVVRSTMQMPFLWGYRVFTHRPPIDQTLVTTRVWRLLRDSGAAYCCPIERRKMRSARGSSKFISPVCYFPAQQCLPVMCHPFPYRILGFY